jgi:carboxypeptidase C (cathepsin A)
MRITIKLILSVWILSIIASGNRADMTQFYASLLPSKSISYLVYSGYGDITPIYNNDSASIYYSAWECSTKRYSDHSTPLIFYISGGPGLSSQFAAFREFGPI